MINFSGNEGITLKFPIKFIIKILRFISSFNQKIKDYNLLIFEGKLSK
jgi:hypothetical protein